MSSDKIIFLIDNQEITAQKHETIWQVAKRLGIEIPHLCYSDNSNYRADGNCRACMVEIEGERVLSASCIRKPENGMKIKTNSNRAKNSRKLVFELLLTDQPKREVSHDKNSDFWRWTDKIHELEDDKLNGETFKLIDGLPVLNVAPSYIHCSVLEILEIGDHPLFLCEVESVNLKNSVKPLELRRTGWKYGG